MLNKWRAKRALKCKRKAFRLELKIHNSLEQGCKCND